MCSFSVFMFRCVLVFVSIRWLNLQTLHSYTNDILELNMRQTVPLQPLGAGDIEVTSFC